MDVQAQIATAQTQQQRHTAQVNSMTGKIGLFSGRILQDQPGESVVDVPFPITFIEIPVVVAGGWDLEPGSVIVAGNFPRVLGCGWATLDYTESATNQRYYTGGRLAITTTGDPTNKMNVHFLLIGRSLVNPLGRDTELA